MPRLVPSSPRWPASRLPRRRRAWILAVSSLVSMLLLLTGCSVPGVSGARNSRADLDSGPDAIALVSSVDDPILRTAEIGLSDGLVSVLVANDSDRVVREATILITAIDAQGRVIRSSAAGGPSLRCCTVSDIAPGATFAVSFSVARIDSPRLADAVVSYRDVAWSSVSRVGYPAVRGRGTQLLHDSGSTTVLGQLWATGAPVAGATVEVIIDRPDGGLSAVVTGHFDCFSTDQVRALRLVLWHRTAPGSTIRSVQAMASPAVRDATSCPTLVEPQPGHQAPFLR